MKFLVIALLVVSVTACNINGDSKVVDVPTAGVTIDGASLFQAKCAVCHRCGQEFTGPPLNGSAARWNNDKALYEFVRNSQSMINTNEYARNLYKKYNSTYMTPFPELTDPEIKAILDYCADNPNR